MNGQPGRIYFVFDKKKSKRNKNHAKIIIFPTLKTNIKQFCLLVETCETDEC